jgi:hypothetical protein
VTEILRAGLLEGVRVEIAGAGSPAGAYSSGCRFDLGGV